MIKILAAHILNYKLILLSCIHEYHNCISFCTKCFCYCEIENDVYN